MSEYNFSAQYNNALLGLTNAKNTLHQAEMGLSYSTVTTPVYQNEDKNVFFTANKDGKTLYAIVNQDDKTGVPASVTWTGNTPKKGAKLINLATKKPLKYKVEGDKTTVTLPANATGTNGVAIKYVIK